ncbi:MAG: DUF1580 domain-containing protein [Isosphaeraceae bacterium]
MIDTTLESLISFRDAAREVPRRGRGRKCNTSTIYRWATAGCRGVTLEWVQIGGSRFTSMEAMARFFERLTVAAQSRMADDDRTGPVPTGRYRTLAQRDRAAAEADRKLAEMGA